MRTTCLAGLPAEAAPWAAHTLCPCVLFTDLVTRRFFHIVDVRGANKGCGCGVEGHDVNTLQGHEVSKPYTMLASPLRSPHFIDAAQPPPPPAGGGTGSLLAHAVYRGSAVYSLRSSAPIEFTYSVATTGTDLSSVCCRDCFAGRRRCSCRVPHVELTLLRDPRSRCTYLGGELMIVNHTRRRPQPAGPAAVPPRRPCPVKGLPAGPRMRP